MASGRFEMRVSEDWIRMVDLARGEEPRGGFVKRLVEGALGGVVAEDARPSERAVPAARVTSVSVGAAALSAPEGTPPLSAAPDLASPEARRRALGLPAVRRSPALERFAPDGEA